MAAKETERRSFGDLPEELIPEILACVPPKHLLRFRAACKAWCDLAADPAFIRKHHSRQPAQPLLLAYDEHCLEAVNLSTNRRRAVMRVTVSGRVPSIGSDALALHGSCDGLLLLGFRETFLVCNPATRQGARLRLLFRDGPEFVGFYRHAASGEYRVLYHLVEGLDGEYSYYVLSLGSQQAIRDIELLASSAAVAAGLARGLESSSTSPPVLFRGRLHWRPQRSQGGNILVFDTDAESFSWIPPPAEAMLGERHHAQLFEMDGTLAMFCCHQSAQKSVIWFMEDYEQMNWVKHPVELSFTPAYDPAVLYQGGDVLVLESDMLVLESPGKLSHYDKMDKLQGSVNCFARGLRITPHVLKESLILPEFLRKQQKDGTCQWFPELEFP